MTDYTKECPICGSDDVETRDHDDDYVCNYCRSVYTVSSDKTDYVVWQDNSDGIAGAERGLYSGRNYRRARYV